MFCSLPADHILNTELAPLRCSQHRLVRSVAGAVDCYLSSVALFARMGHVSSEASHPLQQLKFDKRRMRYNLRAGKRFCGVPVKRRTASGTRSLSSPNQSTPPPSSSSAARLLHSPVTANCRRPTTAPCSKCGRSIVSHTAWNGRTRKPTSTRDRRSFADCASVGTLDLCGL